MAPNTFQRALGTQDSYRRIRAAADHPMEAPTMTSTFQYLAWRQDVLGGGPGASLGAPLGAL
eukprot:8878469-Pyramimonas_sp.AAC.1